MSHAATPEPEDPISYKSIEKRLKAEHKLFSQKFCFAQNDQSTSLTSLFDQCSNSGVAFTAAKEKRDKQIRSKIEHDFFKKGIDRVLEGHVEPEFEDQFVRYILQLDFDHVTDEEKRVIMSKVLKFNTVSRSGVEALRAWLRLPPEEVVEIGQKEVKKLRKAHSKDSALVQLAQMNKHLRTPIDSEANFNFNGEQERKRLL